MEAAADLDVFLPSWKITYFNKSDHFSWRFRPVLERHVIYIQLYPAIFQIGAPF
jgi:hypothetical protein